MAIIKSLEGLPSWFAREKYDAAEGFMAAQWYEHLNRRRKLLEIFDYRLERKVLLEEDGQPSYELNLWRLRLAAAELAAIRAAPLELGDKSSELLNYAPVKTVRTRDLMNQMDRDTAALRDGVCGEDALKRWSVIADPEAYYGPNEAIAELPVSLDYYIPNRKPAALIQIDLEATDPVLVTAFKAWLKAARAEHKLTHGDAKPDKKKSIYTNWARSGLLPYLDLKIWMMETGDQIPIQVINDAISRYRSSDSNFAKTTIPLAQRLMLDLTQLRALSVGEALQID